MSSNPEQYPDAEEGGSLALSPTERIGSRWFDPRRYALVGLVFIAAASQAPWAGAAATTASGAQLVKVALSAAKQAGSVTMVLINKVTGRVSYTTTQEATATGGALHITTRGAGFQTNCSPSACYVMGNDGGLVHGMGLTAANGTALAGKWLLLPATSQTATERSLRTSMLDDSTLSSITGSGSFPPSSVWDGGRTFRVANTGKTALTTITFSHWGAHVSASPTGRDDPVSDHVEMRWRRPHCRVLDLARRVGPSDRVPGTVGNVSGAGPTGDGRRDRS